MTKIRWNQYREGCPCNNYGRLISSECLLDDDIYDCQITHTECRYETCPYVYWKERD